MCFSKNSSIISFLFGFIGGSLCILLDKPIDKIVGYFFIFISLMQLVEYFLWDHQICNNYNQKLSILGMILNHFQPIVLAILIYIFNKDLSHKNRLIIAILTIIYIILIIPYSMQFLYNKNKNLSCTMKNKRHLYWKWNTLNYYRFIYIYFLFTFVSFALLGLPTIKESIVFSIIAVLSFLTSYIFYDKSVGALWCYYVVFIPIIYYILRKTILIDF